jgi:glycosyltransferase involved in cell wall biosynthesis
MEPLHFSFIIPVFNRPDEIRELMDSFTKLKGNSIFEVVIIEDGSTVDCKSIVESYVSKLNISYYFKKNSGPGDSRNYGMKRAKGNYFIFLDSDCLLPMNYLEIVAKNLKRNFVDCYGGPDAAHDSFSNLQKAINFAMTSFITTGGIRGGKNYQKNFQPRSFNMGISKRSFEDSKGFGTIHPGEDPDLAIRLKKLGYSSALFKEAFVYHKRRISWLRFYRQVYKFGLVRPILNQWHPETNKFIYWLPTLFSIGFAMALLLLLVFQFKWAIILYMIYFLVAFIIALVTTKNLYIAVQSIIAIFIQFMGYGYGFLKSTLKLASSNKSAEQHFPKLFFKHVK